MSVDNALRRFGKVGLLVDDERSIASRRTARELYGSDALPDWWLVLGSVACANEALEAFFRWPETDRAGVLLLDRLLPISCRETDARPMAWEAAGVEPARQLLGLVNRARHDRTLVTALQTSYPDATDRELRWERRGAEVLTSRRERLRALDLLRYGPAEPDPRATWQPNTGEETGFRRARWRRVI